MFFANAHALEPNARTLRGLGLACYESRNYVEAIDFLQQALTDKRQPLVTGMRDETSRLLAQAQQFVSRVHVELQPPDARLVVDNKPSALGPDGILLLDPGPHELSAQAQGFQPLTRTVTAEGGKELQASLLLSKIEPESRPAPANESPFVEEPTLAKETAMPAAATKSGEDAPALEPWIVVAASGAVAITGTVFLVVAANDKSRAEHPGPDATWSDVQRATNQGRSFTMLGVGLAGVAAGLVWKFLPSARGREATTNLYLTPGAVVISGRL